MTWAGVISGLCSNRASCFQAEHAGENRQAAKDHTFGLAQQLVAPVERRRSVWWRGKAVRGRRSRSGSDPRGGRRPLDAERGGARGRQLDRQRDAVEPPANRRDHAALRWSGAKCRSRARPLDEQPNPAVAQQVVASSASPRVQRAAAPDRSIRPRPAAARGWWRGVQRRPARSTASASAAAAPITCSHVSSTSTSLGRRAPRPRRAVTSPPPRPSPIAAATVTGTSPGSAIGGNSTSQTPSANCGRSRRAAESEPRLADAAGPVRVTSRCVAARLGVLRQERHPGQPARKSAPAGSSAATPRGSPRRDGLRGDRASPRLLPCRHRPPGCHIRCRFRQ